MYIPRAEINSSELNRNFLLCKFCSIVSSEGAKPKSRGEAAKMKLHGNREGVEQAAASFEQPGLVFPFRSMRSTLRMTLLVVDSAVSLRSIDRFFVGELHRDSCPIFTAPRFDLARSGEKEASENSFSTRDDELENIPSSGKWWLNVSRVFQRGIFLRSNVSKQSSKIWKGERENTTARVKTQRVEIRNKHRDRKWNSKKTLFRDL